MFEEILRAYRQGDLDEAETQRRIMQLFYEQGESFMLDLHRQERIGFPEVVYAQGKTDVQLLEIMGRILEERGTVYISTVSDAREALIRQRFGAFAVTKAGRIMAIVREASPLSVQGTVGIITAGTSDIPYAQECALLLEHLGVQVITAFDVGAAGIHRPFICLKQLRSAEVLIVLAGMEGVLPTILSALTGKPIIALPTSVGYGMGGQGYGALVTMLQSCSPGVTVVNIDNTVGAAAAALRIVQAIEHGRQTESG